MIAKIPGVILFGIPGIISARILGGACRGNSSLTPLKIPGRISQRMSSGIYGASSIGYVKY